MLSGVGSPAESALLVLKENSAYLLTGEPDQTTGGAADLVVNKMTVAAGCVSQTSVVRTPYGIVWAGPSDVWLFHSGALPVSIGKKISPVLASSPAATRYKWHAEYFGGFYRLALMTPGQGPDDDAPCGEQWWLDMREGAPETWIDARWYGPQIYNVPTASDTTPTPGTFCMAVDTVVDQDRPMFGVNEAAGTLNIYRYDSSQGYDDCVGDYLPESLYGNEILTKIIGGVKDFGQATRDHVFEKTEMDVRSTFPAQLDRNATHCYVSSRIYT
jgi:hypothetical protein